MVQVVAAAAKGKAAPVVGRALLVSRQAAGASTTTQESDCAVSNRRHATPVLINCSSAFTGKVTTLLFQPFTH
jgi:hypothetical protein